MLINVYIIIITRKKLVSATSVKFVLAIIKWNWVITKSITNILHISLCFIYTSSWLYIHIPLLITSQNFTEKVARRKPLFSPWFRYQMSVTATQNAKNKSASFSLSTSSFDGTLICRQIYRRSTVFFLSAVHT